MSSEIELTLKNHYRCPNLSVNDFVELNEGGNTYYGTIVAFENRSVYRDDDDVVLVSINPTEINDSLQHSCLFGKEQLERCFPNTWLILTDLEVYYYWADHQNLTVIKKDNSLKESHELVEELYRELQQECWVDAFDWPSEDNSYDIDSEDPDTLP